MLSGEKYLEVFRKYRNFVPVVSIEGHEDKTNKRRGDGMYDTIQNAMKLMRENKVLFGTSVTVTKENMEEVKNLAPDDADREYMKNRLAILREKYEEVVFVSFPGDEKTCRRLRTF